LGWGRLRTIAALFWIAILSAVGCKGPDIPIDNSSQEVGTVHEMLNAVVWQKTSAERIALARQAYGIARLQLDAALLDPAWTAALEQTGKYSHLPPAIMMDIDETVLDNTTYETRIVRELGQFSPESFASWCREVSASAVPGVTEFLNYAHNEGVTIILFSARSEELHACTLENLKKLGLSFEQRFPSLLLDDGSTKTERRAEVAKYYRILLLIGDNLEDFVSGSHALPKERREIARQYADNWGKKWIVLPNPMYGHWDAAFYDFEYSLPRSEQIKKKRTGLEESPNGSR